MEHICLHLLVRVGGIIISARTSDDISEWKNALKAAFKMRNPGAATFILGIEIDHDKVVETVMIKQTGYIGDIAERFGQRDAKRVNNTHGYLYVERTEMQSNPYCYLIRFLLYITTFKIGYMDMKHQLADVRTIALGTKTLLYRRNDSGVKAKVTEQ
ncbi:polyprotein [Phytophthora megakarya]|uniref:Polyprotein n=1 Tax=Phytophthora megakarya TaxID=4795 RepID=A0A225UV88_9STRA|nr:polyprotein [Phytophthora megakarya]